MSNANSVVKVLATALKRIEKGRWGQGTWQKEGENIVTAAPTHLLCLEGSITNGSSQPRTQVQEEALQVMRDVMNEWHGVKSIPSGNDHRGFTHAMAIEIARESLRRAKGEQADRAQRTGPDMQSLMEFVEEDERAADCKIPDAWEQLIDAGEMSGITV